MKEKYIAPDLCFESVKLSQSIAVGCNTDITNMYLEAQYFVNGNPHNYPCANQWDDSIHEGYCYWEGAEKLFLS